MAAPPTASAFLQLVRKSGLLSEETLARLKGESLPAEPIACAEQLVRRNLLTSFQAKQILSGRYRGLVLGPYRVLRMLGKGGMGTVYLADHATLNRKVALKVLTAQKGNDPLHLERFYREARAVAALDHPNIVRLFDVSQVQDLRFLVMEHVDGLNLETLLEQTGPLHYAQAAGYVVQAAAGLQHAHEKGFVHRDIKPANLVLAKDGTVKILDMGLTRAVDNPKDDLTSKYDESAVSGTADFASPEQALNVTIDARSDIYSLGATLFTLVTGQVPFGGTTTQKLTQHQLTAPPDLCKLRPSVPAELGAIVGRMMAKAPRDRYQTAREVIDALAPWAGPAPGTPGVSVATPPPKEQTRAPEKAAPGPVRPKARPAGSRRKQWIVVGTIALLAVTAGLALAFARGKKPTGAVPPPPSNPAEVPASNPGTSPDPGPKGPEVVVYRLDLSATKPFVHSRVGRTIDAQPAFAGAPEGWGSHSWYPDCTHEFFAAVRGPYTGLGIRFTSRPANNGPAGMLYLHGVAVEPNRAYALRVVYQTSGSYGVGDVRVRELQTNRLRIVGKDRLVQTSGAWTTLVLPYKNGPTDRIQVEFHHNGPLGTDNELMVRGFEIIEDEPR